MWTFTIYGFYSIACADKKDGTIDPETVMVRARVKAHLENLQERFDFLREFKILSWNNRDYRWRIICPKHLWASALAEMALEQEWSNFKSEATANKIDVGAGYISALHAVWNRMLDLQDGGLYGRKPYVRDSYVPFHTPSFATENDPLVKRGGRKRKKGQQEMLWTPCKKCGRDTLQESGVCMMCEILEKEGLDVEPAEEDASGY